MYYNHTIFSPLPYLLHEVHTSYIVRCTYAHASKYKSNINIRRQSAKKANGKSYLPYTGTLHASIRQAAQFASPVQNPI